MRSIKAFGGTTMTNDYLVTLPIGDLWAWLDWLTNRRNDLPASTSLVQHGIIAQHKPYTNPMLDLMDRISK